MTREVTTVRPQVSGPLDGLLTPVVHMLEGMIGILFSVRILFRDGTFREVSWTPLKRSLHSLGFSP